MKWVSELDPCFLIVVGHYICVKPTQGIFKKQLCNPKKIVFVYKKGVVKNIKNLDYKIKYNNKGVHGDTSNVHVHVTTCICHL